MDRFFQQQMHPLWQCLRYPHKNGFENDQFRMSSSLFQGDYNNPDQSIDPITADRAILPVKIPLVYNCDFQNFCFRLIATPSGYIRKINA